MKFAELIGQTLDEKYQIERELGRGGMGTVYLATHLGTERPVAVKIIAPQFMERPEFVERFRREARAAGRLRHPNVVDVTDFGFADTDEGQVAYLVMEYLDGCTLGEILEEERNLPVSWTLDILEQVCSAVQEAHDQGIIHRDLKPDNIWLEPNQRGGYTVKVLDFGIAKLESHSGADSGEFPASSGTSPTRLRVASPTLADSVQGTAIHDSISPTLVSESATAIIDGNGSERSTAILNISLIADEQDTVGTKIISGQIRPVGFSSAGTSDNSLSTKELTRVGAVLGTPLYMSPEQCRGEKLDARSDVYSLGIIAYQMLSGATPFSGDFTRVMEHHQSVPPPPLKAKNVRKKLKRVIGSALAKDPSDRPETAEAFASILRSRSEGIFGLLRRAGMIYSEHMPKFLLLSAFFHLPMLFFTGCLIVFSFLKATDTINDTLATVGIGISGTGLTVITAFCASLITGTITWIVTQSLAVPLRPIRIRASLKEARNKWKTFAGAGILQTLLSVSAGVILLAIGFVVPFLFLWPFMGFSNVSALISVFIGSFVGIAGFAYASTLLMLTAPVVMMEKTTVVQAMRRSVKLIRRSMVTSLAAFIIMFLIPAVLAGVISAAINLAARGIDPELRKDTVVEETNTGNSEGAQPEEQKGGVDVSYGNNRRFELSTGDKKKIDPLKKTILETLLQIILQPIQIIVISFTAIIVALLYLKTRQAGGECLQDLLAKFEETDQPRKKWQERVRQRLIQSGRITSRSS
ncbi:MAG: protein kinase domain-containing protein [Blastocatellia bacterium]